VWFAPVAVAVYPTAAAAQPPAVGGQLVMVRNLRATFMLKQERLDVTPSGAQVPRFTDELISPHVLVRAGVAILDPRILTLNLGADVRLDWRDRKSSVAELDNYGSQRNWRLDAMILGGRSAPFRVYYESGRSLLEQHLPAPVDGSPATTSRQRARQRSKGFIWDITTDRLPHIVAQGSVTQQRSLAGFLSARENRSEQRRLEVRATRDHRWLRYDLALTHDAIKVEVPALDLSSRSAVDTGRGSVNLTAGQSVRIGATVRTSRFQFDAANGERRARGFDGWGGGTSLFWQISPRWQLVTNYSLSTNLAEFAMSSREGAGSVQATVAVSGDAPVVNIERRTLFQESTSAIQFSSSRKGTTAAIGVRHVSLDPLPLGRSSLDTLTVGTARADHQRTVAGFGFSAGAEVAAGQVVSNRAEHAEYREVGGRLRVWQRVGFLYASADGSLRDTQAPSFHPVAGRTWDVGVRLQSDRPTWARATIAARRSLRLRDIVLRRGEDRIRQYTAAIRSGGVTVSFDYLDTDSSTHGLFDASLLEFVSPETLLLTRPELFGLLWASQRRSRHVSVRATLRRGLTTYANARFDRDTYQMQLDLDRQVGQAGLTWAVRQLYVEVAYEYLRYRSSLGAPASSRRLLVSVRRDITIF